MWWCPELNTSHEWCQTKFIYTVEWRNVDHLNNFLFFFVHVVVRHVDDDSMNDMWFASVGTSGGGAGQGGKGLSRYTTTTSLGSISSYSSGSLDHPCKTVRP